MNWRLLLLFLCCGIAQVRAQGITGTISINRGDKTTNDRKVMLTLSSTKGAGEMLVSNDPSFAGAAWRRFEMSIQNWRLTDGDGIKKVYAKFRDASGNISEAVEAVIELDREPPQNPEIIINSGREYTNNKTRSVYIELNAQDAVQMRVSTRNDFLQTQWVPFRREIKDFKIPPPDGKKEIFVQYRDRAGNVSPTVSASVIIDLDPPTGCKVEIEDGLAMTNKKIVKIKAKAEGATEMIVRGGEWMPYKDVFDWELTGGDGEKTITMKFRDAVGNESQVVSDVIFLDSQPPSNGLIIINNQEPYTVSFNNNQLKIIAIGASEMLLANTPDFAGASWIAYSPLMPNWPLRDVEGPQKVFVKFRDKAGNESDVYSDEIILDKTPPSKAYVSISSPDIAMDTSINAKVVRNDAKMVDLELNAVGADYMMISNVNTFYGASWELYRPKIEKWELGGINDGARSVFVKFRDKAGNVSEVALDKVIVDTQPPVDGKITVNNNEEYCTDKEGKVNLQIFARGAQYMMLSSDASFENAKWEPYRTEKPWKLIGDDGMKSVAIKFKDVAGNESQAVIDNIIWDRQGPRDLAMEVNKGDSVTNNPDKVVLVKVRAADAALMQVANTADFSGARWRAYSPLNFNHQLAGDDGLKTIYARFKDEAGNVSDVVQANIRLDRTPPMEGKVEIEGGGTLTNNRDAKVNLQLSAKGAAEMIISNRMDFKESTWEPFNATKEWVLAGPDGLKTIYAKFRDKIGNESKLAYARIGIDRTAPKDGTIVINNGEKFCTNVNKYVTLRLYAQDVAEMMIANDEAFTNGKWVKYDMIVQNWILDGDDGDKRVFAKFRDVARNETQRIVGMITLDRQEPVGEEVTINNGEPYTNDKTHRVQLTIKADDATEMMISNTPTFAPPAKWEAYKESKDWVLSGKDGDKYIYAKFRDPANNVSSVAKGHIRLDTEAPIPQYIKVNGGKTSTDNTRVNLMLKAKDAKYMMVANNGKFEGATWEPYTESKVWDLEAGEGLKRVFVKFKDDAQNESSNIFADITVYSKL